VAGEKEWSAQEGIIVNETGAVVVGWGTREIHEDQRWKLYLFVDRTAEVGIHAEPRATYVSHPHRHVESK
jgi:hypothetical protein